MPDQGLIFGAADETFSHIHDTKQTLVNTFLFRPQLQEQYGPCTSSPPPIESKRKAKDTPPLPTTPTLTGMQF